MSDAFEYKLDMIDRSPCNRHEKKGLILGAHRGEVERAATSARLDGKIEAYIEINDQWPDLMVGREWFDNQLKTYIDRAAMGAVK